jgi:hypothetical protein
MLSVNIVVEKRTYYTYKPDAMTWCGNFSLTEWRNVTSGLDLFDRLMRCKRKQSIVMFGMGSKYTYSYFMDSRSVVKERVSKLNWKDPEQVEALAYELWQEVERISNDQKRTS